MRVLKWVAFGTVATVLLASAFLAYQLLQPAPVPEPDPALLAGPAPAPEPTIVGDLRPAAAPIAFQPPSQEQPQTPDTERMSSAAEDPLGVPLGGQRYLCVFHVQYRPVEEMVELLNLVDAEIRADKATGSLIVAGPQEALRAVQYLLENLDVQVPRASVKVQTTAASEQPADAPVAIVSPTTDEVQPEEVPSAGTHQYLVQTYRIAAAYLRKPELENLADTNRCIAAIQDWLGGRGAEKFPVREVDHCLETLTGLGLIAAVESHAVQLPGPDAKITVVVASDGAIAEGAEDVIGALTLEIAAAKVTMLLDPSTDQTPVALETADSACLAYIGSPTDQQDDNATGVLVVLTPAPVQAADASGADEIKPSSYER